MHICAYDTGKAGCAYVKTINVSTLMMKSSNVAYSYIVIEESQETQ